MTSFSEDRTDAGAANASEELPNIEGPAASRPLAVRTVVLDLPICGSHWIPLDIRILQSGSWVYVLGSLGVHPLLAASKPSLKGTVPLSHPLLSGGKLGKVRCRVMGEAKGLLPGSAS